MAALGVGGTIGRVFEPFNEVGVAGGGLALCNGILFYSVGSVINADGFDRGMHAVGVYGDDQTPAGESMLQDAREADWDSAGRTFVAALVPLQLGDAVDVWEIYYYSANDDDDGLD